MNNTALKIVLKSAFLGMGVIMLGIAFFIYNGQANFIRNSQTTQGTVIKNQRHMSVDAGSGDVYAPVVNFTTADGQTQQFEARVQSSPPAHQVGDKVDVLYNPKNPSDAQINSPFELYLAVYIVGGLGAVFFITGLFVFFLV